MELIASILMFYSLFHRWLLSTALLCGIGAAVDNQTDSQQFSTHYYAFSA
jgi:hypothetical protein